VADDDPGYDLVEVPGIGPMPTAVPPAAKAIAQGLIEQAMIPGRVAQGQQPQVPGQWSDLDEALAQANMAGQYRWGPRQALSMLGGASPFAGEGVGIAGGKLRPAGYGKLPELEAKTPWQEAQPIVDANAGKGLEHPIEETSDNLRLHLQRQAKAEEKGTEYPGGLANERTVIHSSDPNLPDFVTGKITFQDWIDRHEAIMSPEEIQSASQWYKDLRGQFLQHTGGNAPLADKYLHAWLVAQQNVGVAPAMGNVLLQAEQIARGVPAGQMRAAGMPNPTEAARAVISGEPIKQGVGQKISDFVDSAEGKAVRSWMANHPDGGAPFVVDVHTARDMGRVDKTLKNLLLAKGYNKKDLDKLNIDLSGGGIKGTAYEHTAQFGRDLTDHLNKINWQGRSDWTPSEAQAVGWMGMTRLTHERAQDVQTAIGRNIRNISMELSPGKGSPWAQKYGADFGALSPADQTAITHQITTEAINHAARISGIDSGTIVTGLGAWHQYRNPSTVAQTFASKDGADIAANILGHLLHQTEVWSNSVKPLTTSPKAFAVDFIANGQHTLNNADGLRDFWSRVIDADPLKGTPKALFQGFQPIKSPEGLPGIRALIDRGGAKTQETLEKALAPGGSIHSMISLMPSKAGEGIDMRLAEAEIAKHRNDWTKDTNGEAYTQRLVQALRRDPTADLRSAGQQLEARLKASIQAAKGRGQAGEEGQIGRARGGAVYSLEEVYGNSFRREGGGVDKAKKAKTDPEIRYQWRPHGNQWCGRCAMFRAPDVCTAVAGKIARHGWCRIFSAKKT